MATRKRVQSDPNLPLVPLTPSIQAQGGTFSTAAINVPKTNSALRITNAINALPSLTGQLSNINEKRGIKAAEQLTAQELDDIMSGKVTAPDGGLTGGLGFRKAFGSTFGKRWWETVGMKEYMELESELDADVTEMVRQGLDIDVARGAIQQKINAKREQIEEYFAERPFAKGINNLIHPQVSDKLEVGLLKGYQKKVEEVQIGFKIEEINEDLGNFASGAKGDITLKDQMQVVSDKLNNLPIPNSKKKEVLRNALVSVATVKLNNRDWDSTTELLKEAEGMTMFKDLESSVKISTITKALQQGIQQDSRTSIPTLKTQFVGARTVLGRQLKLILEGINEYDSDTIQPTIKGVIDTLHPNTNKETKAKLTQELENVIQQSASNKDPQTLLKVEAELLRQAQIGGASSLPNRIFNASVGELARLNAELNSTPPSQQLGVLVESDRELIVGQVEDGYSKKARDAFLVNPSLTPKGYMAGFRVPSIAAPEEVVNAYDKVKKIRTLMGSKTYSATNANIRAAVKSTVASLTSELDAETFEERLNNINKEAPGIIEFPDDFQQTVMRNVQLRVDQKLKDGLIEDEVELNKEIENQIQNEVEDYKTQFEAKENFINIQSQAKLKAFNERKGKALYLYNYAKDKESYWDELLQNKFWGWDSVRDDTKDEWKEIEALKENNLDAQIGYDNSDKVTLTEAILQQNIDSTRKEDVVVDGTSAFKSILRIYGYPQWDVNNVVSDLDRIGHDWTEIKLFKDEAELEEVKQKFSNVLAAFVENPDKTQFSTKERKLLDVAVSFGLYPDDDLTNTARSLVVFYTIQRRLLSNR